MGDPFDPFKPTTNKQGSASKYDFDLNSLLSTPITTMSPPKTNTNGNTNGSGYGSSSSSSSMSTDPLNFDAFSIKSTNSSVSLMQPTPNPTDVNTAQTAAQLLKRSGSSSELTESEQNRYHTAISMVQTSYGKLEKGQFAPALQDIDSALHDLTSDKPQSFLKEIRLCVNYKLLLQLLLENKKSEANINRSATLTRILAEIPVQPKHRVVCQRMAVNKNLEAKNFGIASRIIRQLLQLNLKDKESLEQKLKICEENKFKDSLPKISCSKCQQQSLTLGDLSCSNCQQPLLFSHRSFEPIVQTAHYKCQTCLSIHSLADCASNSNCTLCDVGPLQYVQVGASNNSTSSAPPPLPSKSNSVASNDDPFSKFLDNSTPINPVPVTSAATLPPLPKKENKYTPTTTAPPPALPKKETAAPTLPEKPAATTTAAPPSLPKKNAAPPARLTIDTIPTERISEFQQQFVIADANGDGQVDGGEAKSYFTKNTSLPNSELAKVWRLAKRERPGPTLSKAEFYVALHLVHLITQGDTLPDHLPESLYRSSISMAEAKNTSSAPAPALPSKSSSVPIPAAAAKRFSDVPPALSASLEGPALMGPPPPPTEEEESEDDRKSPAKMKPALPPKQRKQSTSDNSYREIKVTKSESDYSAAAPKLETSSPEASPARKRKSQKGRSSTELAEKRVTPKVNDTRASATLRPSKSKTIEDEIMNSEPTTTTAPSLPAKNPKPSVTINAPAPTIKTSSSAETITNTERKFSKAPPPLLITPPMLAGPTLPDVTTRLGGLHTLGVSTEAPESSTTTTSGSEPSTPHMSNPLSIDSSFVGTPTRRTRANTFDQTALRNSSELFLRDSSQLVHVPWLHFGIETQGVAPPTYNYHEHLPADVKLAAQFVECFIVRKDVDRSFKYLALSANQKNLDDKLRSFLALKEGVWFCQAFSNEQQIMIPIYYNHQAYGMLLKVSSDASSISSLDFNLLDDDWRPDPMMQKWTISAPRIVKKKDGTPLEIKNNYEEMSALMDPDVPVGLWVGEKQSWQMALKTKFEYKPRKPDFPQAKYRDGKKYFCFRRYAVDERTKAVHPQAAVREYWLSKREDTSHVIRVLYPNGDAINDEEYVEHPDGDLESVTDYQSKKKKNRIALPKITVPPLEHMYIVQVLPPEAHFQSLHVSTITSNVAGFLSADKKAFIMTAPAEKRKGPMDVELRFQMSLRYSSLKPRYEGGEFVKAKVLSSKERFLQLASGTEIDYKTDDFQKWLGKHSLLKNILFAGESEVHFARRVFLWIVKEVDLLVPDANANNNATQTKNYTQPSVTLDSIQASSIVPILTIANRGSGSEEDLHRLFVAILRFANIPSRVLYGRSLHDGIVCTRAQFFVDTSGWIPISFSASMRLPSSTPPQNWNSERNKILLAGFGVNDANFLSFMNGKHLNETPVYGPRMLDPSDFNLDFEFRNKSTTLEGKKLPTSQ